MRCLALAQQIPPRSSQRSLRSYSSLSQSQHFQAHCLQRLRPKCAVPGLLTFLLSRKSMVRLRPTTHTRRASGLTKLLSLGHMPTPSAKPAVYLRPTRAATPWRLTWRRADPMRLPSRCTSLLSWRSPSRSNAAASSASPARSARASPRSSTPSSARWSPSLASAASVGPSRSWPRPPGSSTARCATTSSSASPWTRRATTPSSAPASSPTTSRCCRTATRP
mmetsp:Transcript_11558/g.37079  ORF Transcript_11558/g.37079 Transcript_11558/m.37079 type:complete len:222 (-) Transcript_11558:45-710(-)